MAANSAPGVDALAQFLSANPPKTAQDMRRMLDGFAFLMNADAPEVGALHEGVPIAAGVAADVAVPKGPGPHPVLVYLHGGGYVIGSVRTHRLLVGNLSRAAAAKLCSSATARKTCIS